MAIVAVVATVDMALVLAGRGNAVVAGPTGSIDLGVVDRIDRYPDIRCVAIFADVAGLYMRRVLARGLRAVMAADTISSDVDVIEVRG